MRLIKLIGTTFLGRNGEPRDVVGTVSFLVSKDAAFITGMLLSLLLLSALPMHA